MNTRLPWIGALGLGAALMFVLDPQMGPRRRQRLADRMRRWTRPGEDRVEDSPSDRDRGIPAETPVRLHEGYVDDQTLTAQLRSAIDRVVSSPRAIDVWVLDGRVTLCGPVLAQELPSLLEAVKSVRGVRAIDQRLDTQEHAGGVAGLRSEE